MAEGTAVMVLILSARRAGFGEARPLGPVALGSVKLPFSLSEHHPFPVLVLHD